MCDRLGTFTILLSQRLAPEYQPVSTKAHAELVHAQTVVSQQRLLDAAGELLTAQVGDFRVIANQ